MTANAPPTASSQPVRGSVRRSRVRASSPRPATTREAEQPARLPAQALVEQAQDARLAAERPVAPAEAAASTGAAAGLRAAGPAVLAEQAAEAVVAEDQRPDAVVVRAGHPRPVGGRGEPHEHRPGEPDDGHRGAAGEQLARPRRARPRGAIHSHAAAMPRDDEQRGGHLRLEAEPDAHARQHEPARAAVLEPADDAPTPPRRSRATSSASGLLWRQMATLIGVSASTSPAVNAAARPKRRRTRS